MDTSKYDFVFLGAGCSSLSIIMRMIESHNFSQKKILLIDKEEKTKNDRTWCFWEKDAGFFDEIVFKKWHNLNFKTDDLTIALDIYPYTYKMIRGIDFYNFCFKRIRQQDNIDVIYGNISFGENVSSNRVFYNGQDLAFRKEVIIFNSIFSPPKAAKNKFYLLQHFKGWIVETPVPFFHPEEATLMDFRTSQMHGTTFFYILPLSSTRALIEYTLFSEKLLDSQDYDKALQEYCDRNLSLKNYTIVNEEFGVIPMTNAFFPHYFNGMYNIGTAGGQTKASTGYTFQFIQKQATLVVEKLNQDKLTPEIKKTLSRFDFYDSTLLHILSKKIMTGKKIFSILFKENDAFLVLKFLDNQTTITEEYRLLNTLPKKTFLTAGIKELLKMLPF